VTPVLESLASAKGPFVKRRKSQALSGFGRGSRIILPGNTSDDDDPPPPPLTADDAPQSAPPVKQLPSLAHADAGDVDDDEDVPPPPQQQQQQQQQQQPQQRERPTAAPMSPGRSANVAARATLGTSLPAQQPQQQQQQVNNANHAAVRKAGTFIQPAVSTTPSSALSRSVLTSSQDIVAVSSLV
jgi:hypothetical protein